MITPKGELRRQQCQLLLQRSDSKRKLKMQMKMPPGEVQTEADYLEYAFLCHVA